MSNFWDSQPQKRPTKVRSKEAVADPMLASWGISNSNASVSMKKTVTKKKIVEQSDSSDSDIDVAAMASLSSFGFVRSAQPVHQVGSDMLVRKNEQSSYTNDDADGQTILDPSQSRTYQSNLLPNIPLYTQTVGVWCEDLARHIRTVMNINIDMNIKLDRCKICMMLIYLALASGGSILYDGEQITFDAQRIETVPILSKKSAFYRDVKYNIHQVETQYTEIVSFAEDSNVKDLEHPGSAPFSVVAGAEENRTLIQDPYVLQSLDVLVEFSRLYEETTGTPAISPILQDWLVSYKQYNSEKPTQYGSILDSSVYMTPVGTAVNYFNHLIKTKRSPIAVEQPNCDCFFLHGRDDEEEGLVNIDQMEDLDSSSDNPSRKNKTCICTLDRSIPYSDIHLLNCPCCTGYYIPMAAIARDLHTLLPMLAKQMTNPSEVVKKKSIQSLCMLLLLTPTSIDQIYRASVCKYEQALDIKFPVEFPSFSNSKYKLSLPNLSTGAYSSVLAVKHEHHVQLDSTDHAEYLDLDSFIVLLPLLTIRLSTKILDAEQQADAAAKGQSMDKESSIGVKLGCLHMIALLLQRSSPLVITSYISDIIMFLISTLHDVYLFPFVIGRILAPLCDLVPSVILTISNDLMNIILPHAMHKSASVRVAVVYALELILSCGAHEIIRTIAGFQEYNVIDVEEFFGKKNRINTFALLVQDNSPKVRARMVILLGSVLQAHPHRHDYETLLMPYFLTLLSDNNVEVQMLSYAYFTILHLAYAHDPALDTETTVSLDKYQTFLTSSIYPVVGKGMQMIAQKFVPRQLPAAMEEQKAWTAATRGNASRLVLLQLLLSGGSFNQYITSLLPILTYRMEEQYTEAVTKRQDWFPSVETVIQDPSSFSKLDILKSVTSTNPLDVDSMDAIIWCYITLTQHAPPVAIWPSIQRGLDVTLPLCLHENVEHHTSNVFSKNIFISATYLVQSISSQSVLFGITAIYNTYKQFGTLQIPISSIYPYSMFMSSLYHAQYSINIHQYIPPITKTDIRGKDIQTIMSIENHDTILLENTSTRIQELYLFASTHLLSCIGLVASQFATVKLEKTTTYKLLSRENVLFRLLLQVRGSILEHRSLLIQGEPAETVYTCNQINNILHKYPISSELLNQITKTATTSTPQSILQYSLLYYLYLTNGINYETIVDIISTTTNADVSTQQYVTSLSESIHFIHHNSSESKVKS